MCFCLRPTHQFRRLFPNAILFKHQWGLSLFCCLFFSSQAKIEEFVSVNWCSKQCCYPSVCRLKVLSLYLWSFSLQGISPKVEFATTSDIEEIERRDGLPASPVSVSSYCISYIFTYSPLTHTHTHAWHSHTQFFKLVGALDCFWFVCCWFVKHFRLGLSHVWLFQPALFEM